MKKADFPFFSTTSPIKSMSAYGLLNNNRLNDRKLLINYRRSIDVERQNKSIELESAIARVISMRAQEERNRIADKNRKIQSMLNNKNFMRLGEEEPISAKTNDLDQAVSAFKKVKDERIQSEKQEIKVPSQPPVKKAEVKSNEEILESVAKAEEQNKALSGKLGTNVSTDDLLKTVLDDLF